MISMQEAQKACGGEWIQSPLPLNTKLKGGSIDTRNLAGKDIFFTLKGEKTDGHSFLSQLSGQTPKLVVLSKPTLMPNFHGNILCCSDVLLALGALGRCFFEKHHPRLVAISGSFGKTGTKEMVAHALSTSYSVLKTPASYNNEIGVPLTLLELDGSQNMVVLEYAARKVGDIDYLCDIATPEVSILTGIGRAHIGVFGSLENIYKAKTALFRKLQPKGVALYPAKDLKLVETLGEGRTKLSFGLGEGDISAENLRIKKGQGRAFEGVYLGERCFFQTKQWGREQAVFPVLAAWACGKIFGVPQEEIQANLSQVPPVAGRMALHSTKKGALVLDDSYNASLETMQHLVGVMGEMEAKRKILILGAIAEAEEGLTYTALELAKDLSKSSIDMCLVYAPKQPEFAKELSLQQNTVEVWEAKDFLEMEKRVFQLEKTETLFGVKGSRSAHMERFVLSLLGLVGNCHKPVCSLLTHCQSCGEHQR